LFYNQNNTISANWINHIGHAGVFLEGNYPGEGDTLKNNIITNNLIDNVGELLGHGSGVYVMNSSNNEVSYCEIYNSPRYAVPWPVYTDLPKEVIYTHDNTFKYLKVHDTNQDSGDTGSLMAFGLGSYSGGPYNTNYVEQVTVKDIYAHPSLTDQAPNGIFMDAHSYGQSFTNVEVSNTQATAFRNNVSGEHTLNNVSWEGGFDPGLMDYDNIGTTSSFPYSGDEDPPTITSVSCTVATQVRIQYSEAVEETSATNTSNYSIDNGITISSAAMEGTDAVILTTSEHSGEITYTITVNNVKDTATPANTIAPNTQKTYTYSDCIFFDGFESGLGNWTAGKGTPTRTTAEAHTGNYSYVTDEDMDVIYRVFGTSYNKVAVIWFYDDASDTSLCCLARVDEGNWNDSYSWVGLGVDTDISTTKYVRRIGINEYATDITRTTGWHELKWDYTSGTDVDLYIDGTPAGSTTATTSLSKIAMGNWWGSYLVGTNYFDDVEIQN